MIEFETKKELMDYLEETKTIQFQNKTIYSEESLNKFANFLKYATHHKMPENTKCHTFYTNFGTFYVDECYYDDNTIILFNKGQLIAEIPRSKYFDIEMSYTKQNGDNISLEIITFDDENDEVYEY